jgi:CubicO group peptidase (beta-lactamase class C family)
MAQSTLVRGHVHGHVSSGFGHVRDVFAEQFARGREIGAACCVYHRGVKVVDLWGGQRSADSEEPWHGNTMVLMFSATKGLAAMAIALAHSRGWLDYDERVCTYWPEFAQHGKEKITVRQLLAHQAGLFAFDEPPTREIVADPDRLAALLARQTPAWAPGTRQAYHAVSLGFYQGEILRRVDPLHRSLGQFFQDEIADPLGLDAYIRLPENIPNERLAPVAIRTPLEMILHTPWRVTLASLQRHSPIYRALVEPKPETWWEDKARIYARNIEVPSGGGVASARGLAGAYNEFATGGRTIGLTGETLSELSAPARPSEHGFFDEGVRCETHFSLGFLKPSPEFPFGSDQSIAAPGAGGCFGFADLRTQVAYGYVHNRMGGTMLDSRDIALRQALAIVINELEGASCVGRST